jgi:hypothetical protein
MMKIEREISSLEERKKYMFFGKKKNKNYFTNLWDNSIIFSYIIYY